MRPKSLLILFTFLLLTGMSFFLLRSVPKKTDTRLSFSSNGLLSNTQAHEEENDGFTPERLQHEFEMLRNPVTGTIPANIQEIEMRVSNSIPQRNSANALQLSRVNGINGTANQNSYVSVGPNNIGGRSRTLAFDRRNASIVLTGGVTGGIFRSTDGGLSWTFVSGENDIRSANALAQDPANPDIWYCGTGEVFYPTSASDIAGTFGYGVFKSTNNGATWTKLAATEDGQQHAFNGSFDLVHRMAVHPTTSEVYAAVHNRIMKSTNGGTTWTTVLGGTTANTALNGLTDLIISSGGTKIFAAFPGANSDRALAGVWESSTGNVNEWRRIAGGPSGQPDSIAGWQPYGQWGRAVLALNNADTKLFALYKNGKSASGATPEPEADLFRADISSGNPISYTWTNLNSYVPDEPNFNQAGIDPYTTQFSGYNMAITVKPDNDNILFIGGTVLDRVDLTKTDPAQKFRRAGGYGKGFFSDGSNFIYPNHHPDIHGIYFPPGASDVMYTIDDGGVQKTVTSTLADTVRWQTLNTNLQTLQFQFINIHPDLDAEFIIGGTQDNGTYINLNPPALDQTQIQGGDGASAAISQFSKNGNTWKQYWYNSIVEGYIERMNLTWQVSGNNLSLTALTRDDITPTGLATNGQWLTLFINDPDSTEHVYYNNDNKLYRTRTASTVTPSTWTELTGVSNTLTTSQNGSALAISKARDGVKYLYIGTNGGKVYRLDNANTTAAASVPVAITPSTMTAGSYVSGVSVNPRNPDTVMVVVSNYDAAATNINNIFWTGNATSANPTWQVIDGALAPLSSQSCAIVLKTTGVEYYVGTSVGLYSATSITGATTQWFNEGSGMLKKAIVRSLVNRQKDNTLTVGTHGNGAFYAKIGSAVSLDNNIITGINNPIINDKNFIRLVYPIPARDVIFFTSGSIFTVKQLNIQLFGVTGQKVYQASQGYQNGSIDIRKLARGSYILQIISNDGKYKHVQKVLKE